MVDTAKLVKAHINIRNARAELKAEYENKDALLKVKQNKIEAALLAYMNESGQVSGKTPFGSFFKQEEIRPTGSDWGALYEWIKDNDAFDCLEKRITRNFVSQYMKDNNGAVPPGVSVMREFVVRVRRT